MRSSLLALFALTACGGEDAASFDVTPPRAPETPRVDPDAIQPQPADPVVLPSLGPCPAGWSSVRTDGLETCEPWPAAAPPACAPDEMATPAHPACAVVGASCGAEWAENLPASGVLFVRPGATGGDGSRAAPFGTLAGALAAATDGSTVALSRGTFAESAVVDARVSIVGACASATILTSDLPQTPTDRAVLEAGADGVVVANLTIAASERWALIARAGSVRLSHAIVSGGQLGVQAEAGGTLVLETVHLADIDGSAVSADGAAIRLLHVSIERAGIGIQAAGGSASSDDALLADTGDAVQARAGAAVALRDALIERWQESAVALTEPGTSGELERVVIRDASGTGDALAAHEGASLSAVQVVVDRAGRAGALASSPGSAIDLTDVVIRELTGDPAQSTDAFGLYAEGAHLSGRRIYVRGAVTGVLAFLGGASAELTDLTVEDGRSIGSGELGIGVDIQQDATASLSRIHLVRSRSAGLSVTRGASATVGDAAILDTQPSTALGYGVIVAEGGELTLSRAHVEGSSGLGFAITDGAHATVADVSIVGTVSPDDDRGRAAFLGAGLAISTAGALDGTRLAIEDNRDVGLLISGGAAKLDALAVRRTYGDGRALPGFGIQGDRPTSLEITKAIVEDNDGDAIRVEGQLGGGAAAARFMLADATVRGRGDEAPGGVAHGLLVSGNFETTVERLSIERPAFTGIRIAADPSPATLSDVTVTALAPGDSGALPLPRAALVLDGSPAVRASALEIDQAAIAAILLNGSSALTAEDLLIRGVTAAPGCDADCAAAGVVAFPESSGAFERFEIDDAQVAGVQALGGELHLTDGVIARSRVGINHLPGVDPNGFIDRVRFDDDGADFDASALPVPSWPIGAPE